MPEYWLDLGAGKDAEHWCASPAPPGVRRVALDPLITSGMVGSGRLEPVPDNVLRVGAEIRPENSVEAGKERSYLPFRDAVFTHIHCGFVLHLYLETLELLTDEVFRVLAPDGTFEMLLPHFDDLHSEQILQHTTHVMEARFGHVDVSRFTGPFTTFWADLYRDRTYLLRCRRPDSKAQRTQRATKGEENFRQD